MSDNGATLAFIGDIYAGDTRAHVSDNIRRVTTQADAVVANIEGPLTDRGEPRSDKTLHLKSLPENIELLEELSVDVACLANNHMTDWGPTGLRNTIESLEEHQLIPLGAGESEARSARPAILQRAGLRIGLHAFGLPEIGTCPAGPSDPGCHVFSDERGFDAVTELAAGVDIAVVVIHWGATNYHYPVPDHVRLGRRLIEAGATLVIGHHPHVMQGYERLGHAAIVYSLGNFIFGPFHRRGGVVPLSRENRTSAICLARLGPRTVQDLSFVHTRQHRDRVFVDCLDPWESTRRDRFLRRLSRPLGRPAYQRFFKRYVFRRLLYRAARWLNPAMWRKLDRAYLQGLKMALRRLRSRANPT